MELLLSYIYTGLVCKCSWPEKEFLQLDIKIFLVLNDTHFLLCGIKNVSQVTDFKNVSELQLVELFKAADRWLALHLDWICKSAKDLWIFWNCFAWNWAQIVMALTGTGWTTWRTCVRRSWWREWRPPTQLIFSGLFYHKLKQAVPLLVAWRHYFTKA